jgi:D-alanyl-lipoteichoic acid acyltransferase DltB (MBOAT superfamily)
MAVPSLSYFVAVLCLGLILWAGQHPHLQLLKPYFAPLRWDNLLLLGVSYSFYGLFDPLFPILMGLLTLIVFGCSLAIEGRTTSLRLRQQRAWLAVGLASTVGVLLFFKAYLAWSGLPPLGWILPLGFSFYSLQAASYLLDIYQGRIEANHNLINVGLFIAFFPKLLAGPIERAEGLLVQIEQQRSITGLNVERGLFLILQGVFKKLAVVNLIALVIDPVLDSAIPFAERPSAMLWGVMLLITLQLYLDFTSYMDIAQGVGLCFGFELSQNFALPLFAPRLTDFWNRWHISLSNWLRDYLFLPFSRQLMRWGYGRYSVLAVSYLVTMLASGLWHGVGWNYLLWGGLHGVLLFITRWVWPVVLPPQTWWDYGKRLAQIALTFLVVNALFVLFSLPVAQAWQFMLQLVRFDSASMGQVARPLALTVLVWLFFDSLEWWSGDKHGLYKLPAPLRGMLCAGMVALSVIGGLSHVQTFVYAQF